MQLAGREYFDCDSDRIEIIGRDTDTFNIGTSLVLQLNYYYFLAADLLLSSRGQCSCFSISADCEWFIFVRRFKKIISVKFDGRKGRRNCD